MRLCPAISGLLVVIVLTLTSGCEPTCRQVCRGVLSCELGVSEIQLDECEASCVFQEREYEESDDDDRRRALGAHKRCLRRSTCAEIREGECYDEDIFLF